MDSTKTCGDDGQFETVHAGGEMLGVNHFERVTTETKYKIFARLGAQDLGRTRCVCTDWNRLLGPRTLQSLRRSWIRKRRHVFLVSVACFITDKTRVDKSVVVDEEGEFHNVDDFNNLKYRESDVSSHDLVVHFPELQALYGRSREPLIEILVSHPLLRLFERITWNPASTLPGYVFDAEGLVNGKSFSVRGAGFDPSTGLFFLLTMFVEGNVKSGFTTYEIHIYRSEERRWKTINRRLEGAFVPTCYNIGYAVFSEGCFLWIEGLNRGQQASRVRILDMSTEEMHTMAIPDCRQYKRCQRVGSLSWRLKGCDGNLVLMHHHERTGESLAWRLVKSPEWNYEALPLVQHRFSVNPCVFRPSVDMNKDGWWLWFRTDTRKESTEDSVALVDDQGNIRRAFPMANLFHSFLGLPSDLNYIHVKSVLPFETDNFWEVLASA